MNLLQRLKFKLKYFWFTKSIKDNEKASVEIPTKDGPVDIHMAGFVYKTFIRVILTLEIDPIWTDEHIDALATFMLTYPDDIDEPTLLAFLHPEFYDMLTTEHENENVEVELE